MNSQMPSPLINPPQGMPTRAGMSPGADPGMTPQMGIIQKMTQGMAPGQQTKPTPESQSVNMLVTAIKALNQYADILAPSDEANSRTIRSIIKILGEVLKTAQHQQMPTPDQMPTM